MFFLLLEAVLDSTNKKGTKIEPSLLKIYILILVTHSNVYAKLPIWPINIKEYINFLIFFLVNICNINLKCSLSLTVFFMKLLYGI